jgi:hypothetical protein
MREKNVRHLRKASLHLLYLLKPFWILIRIREENRLRNCWFRSQRCQWHRFHQKLSLVNSHFCVWKL